MDAVERRPSQNETHEGPSTNCREMTFHDAKGSMEHQESLIVSGEEGSSSGKVSSSSPSMKDTSELKRSLLSVQEDMTRVVQEEREMILKELDYLRKQLDQLHQTPLTLDALYVWPPPPAQTRLDPEHQEPLSQDESAVISSGVGGRDELKQDMSCTSPTMEPALASQDHRMTSLPTQSGPRRLDMRSHLRHTNGGYGLYGDLFTLKTVVKSRPIYPSLAKSAVKVVSSKDWMYAREEWRLFVLLRKIDSLKSQKMWSLNQMKKCPPPPRKKVHWDYLLEEMNWLAIDFTQERRWKKALASHLAKTIVAYHEAPDKSIFLFKCKLMETTTHRPSSSLRSVGTSKKVYFSGTEESIIDSMEPTPSSDSSSEGMDSSEGTTILGDPTKIEERPIDSMETSSAQVKLENDSNEIEHSHTTDHETTLIAEDSFDKKMTLPVSSISSSFAKISPSATTTISSAPTTSLLVPPVSQRACVLFDEEHPFFYDASYVYSAALVNHSTDSSLWGPPEPTDDWYIDEVEHASLVPLCKWTIRKPTARSDLSSITAVKTLPGAARYDTSPLVSPLFSTKRTKDPNLLTTGIYTNKPPAPLHLATRAAPIWSMEEDDMLQSLARLYQGNWNAVASHVNSSQKTPSQPKSPWDCYNRFSALDKMTLSTTSGIASSHSTMLAGSLKDIHSNYQRQYPYYPSQMTRKESALRQKNLRLESKKKMARHYLSFDHFRKALHFRPSMAARPHPMSSSKRPMVHPSTSVFSGIAAQNLRMNEEPSTPTIPTPPQANAFSRKPLNPLEILLRTRQRSSSLVYSSPHETSPKTTRQASSIDGSSQLPPSRPTPTPGGYPRPISSTELGTLRPDMRTSSLLPNRPMSRNVSTTSSTGRLPSSRPSYSVPTKISQATLSSPNDPHLIPGFPRPNLQSNIPSHRPSPPNLQTHSMSVTSNTSPSGSLSFSETDSSFTPSLPMPFKTNSFMPSRPTTAGRGRVGFPSGTTGMGPKHRSNISTATATVGPQGIVGISIPGSSNMMMTTPSSSHSNLPGQQQPSGSSYTSMSGSTSSPSHSVSVHPSTSFTTTDSEHPTMSTHNQHEKEESS